MFFFWQLEKAKEAADLANIRAAYAEVMSAQLADTKANSSDGVVTYDTKMEHILQKSH